MRSTVRRRPMLLQSLAALVLSAIGHVAAPTAEAHEESKGGITVAHPWSRATPGGSTIGAVFMEIKAAEGVADRLISATTPVAGRVEIHTHVHEGGVMKMRQVEAIALKAGSSALLKPKGDHVMLYDLKAPLKEGDLLPLTLVFEKAGRIEVQATVEPVGAMGPHGMSAQPGHENADHSGHGSHGGGHKH